MTTLTPAYGRDYKTAKAAKADWEAAKDFLVNDAFSRYDGCPANKASFAFGEKVTLRFCAMRKTTVVKA
jgi:hypothetical protein